MGKKIATRQEARQKSGAVAPMSQEEKEEVFESRKHRFRRRVIGDTFAQLEARRSARGRLSPPRGVRSSGCHGGAAADLCVLEDTC